MRDPLARLYVHTVAVEPFQRKGGDGTDRFGAMVILSPLTNTGVLVQGERKEVRTGTGELQLSNTTVYGPLGLQDLFPLDSRVTIGGIESRVLAVNVNDLDARFPQHVEIHLT